MGSYRPRSLFQPPRVPMLSEDAEEVRVFWEENIPGPDFVYFVVELDSEGDYVKIGRAIDPPERIGSLRCGNPRLLQAQVLLVAWHPGRGAGVWEQTESSLHQNWLRKRIHGEWFRDAAEILHIARAASQAQRDAFAAGVTGKRALSNAALGAVWEFNKKEMAA